MNGYRIGTCLAVTAVMLLGLARPCVAATGDADENGFVDLEDYVYFDFCLTDSGPGVQPLFEECLEAFDFDGDSDVDLKDFGAFQRGLGHLPIPLRDTLGNVLAADSTVPYSGRQTCGFGGCHDVDYIANGFKFQQGRTDLDGNVIVQDDYFGDGRYWQRSPGRYGLWHSAGSWTMFSAKLSANESEMDMTTWEWVADCGGCHIGGGPGEFDLDGVRLFDQATEMFGYEVLGKTASDVVFDVDYAHMDSSTGTLSPARWDITGLAEPDCLHCHRPDLTWIHGDPVNRRDWRCAALGGRTDLVDDQDEPVPAFAAAAVAGQGWFSNLEVDGNGHATRLQIDYSVGVNEGSLIENPRSAGGGLDISPAALAMTPPDSVCWTCHGPIGWWLIAGAEWYDTRDIHYAKFNNLSDADPDNDVPPERSVACEYCHPGNLEHNQSKGNSPVTHFRDELDWVGFRTCRDCHWPELSPGVPNPLKHPDAPDPVHAIHFPVMVVGDMINKISCQGCHIPYALRSPVISFTDRTIASGVYFTSQFYSADPLNPADPDKSRWYPSLLPKVDSDGVTRLFPNLIWLSIYWADWDQNDTPEDLSDDLLVPIAEWRVKQVTGGVPPAEVTDDNGDGQLEINRPEEMLAYFQLLKGTDSYGNQLAANPVLVKAKRVWYEDPDFPGTILSFEHEGTGIPAEWADAVWGMDHNVLAAEEAWGSEYGGWACDHCHYSEVELTPVMDRLILVDPFDVDGEPVYETVKDLAGIEMPF